MVNLRKIISLTIFFTLITLVSTLLFLWNSNRKNQILTKTGNTMYDIVFTSANENETINLLIKVLQENSNYKYLAHFKLANIYSNKKDLAEVFDMYSSLASNDKLSSVLNQLAKYFKAVILTKINPQNQQEIYELLTNKVYDFSVKEINATYRLENNEVEYAADILNSILNDENSPLPAKKNAKELLQVALANR